MKNYEKIELLREQIEESKKSIVKMLNENYAGVMINVRGEVEHIDRLASHCREILNHDINDEYQPTLAEQLFDI